MKLDDFVSQTLSSLIEGVKRAQSDAQAAGAKVNPYRGSAESVQVVEFDIELSTTEGSETKAGLGIFVGAVGAGTQGRSEAGARSVGRIRFSVPVELPSPARS